MKRNLSLLLTVLPLLLVACGGGNDEPVAIGPLAEVPASASQSQAGMSNYMRTVTAMPNDSREPVPLDNFNPPKPDDTEPDALS